jgi:hypothetical protein
MNRKPLNTSAKFGAVEVPHGSAIAPFVGALPLEVFPAWNDVCSEFRTGFVESSSEAFCSCKLPTIL